MDEISFESLQYTCLQIDERSLKLPERILQRQNCAKFWPVVLEILEFPQVIYRGIGFHCLIAVLLGVDQILNFLTQILGLSFLSRLLSIVIALVDPLCCSVMEEDIIPGKNRFLNGSIVFILKAVEREVSYTSSADVQLSLSESDERIASSIEDESSQC